MRVVALLVVASLLGLPRPALAKHICRERPTEAQELERALDVFEGTVVRVDKCRIPANAYEPRYFLLMERHQVVVRVDEVLKGAPGSEYTYLDPSPGYLCIPHPQPGERWLLFVLPEKESPDYYCGNSKRLAAPAEVIDRKPSAALPECAPDP